jgi:hypothetical protein
MAAFSDVRRVTGWQRPGGKHGTAPTEVLPGIFTAHYHDIDSREKLLGVLGVDPATTPVLVVNSAPCQCEARSGFFGAGVEVLCVDLEDDPDARKKFDGGKETAMSDCAKSDADVPAAKRCAGDVKVHFDAVSAAMGATLAAGGVVLCHCHASISRSAAFIVAHMVRTGCAGAGASTVVGATAAVKAKWAATWPCDAFVYQLLEYERELAAARRATSAAWASFALGFALALGASKVHKCCNK